MKKLLVLFVALAVASTAFAADFSFSWDTDWGWSSNFDDVYNSTFSELELAVAADVDEYNSFAIEIEPANADLTGLRYNKMTITTDMGAYLGLSGVGVSWVNGFTDPGDEEYADVLRVGLQNAGINAVDLTKDWTTDVNLDFGAFWASAAANWNLASTDDLGTYETQYQFLVGSVDAVAGLSVEAGVMMWDDGIDSGNYLQFDGAYVFPVDDALSLTVAGSFASNSEGDRDLGIWEQALGAGLGVDFAVDDMTALNASVEFEGDDDEMLRVLGGGVGLTYGDFGADVDMAYAMNPYAVDSNGDGTIDGTDEPADGDLLGVDLSGFVKIGLVQFRVGYAVTDYNWANNNRADIPFEGGAYMRVTADF